MIFKKIRYYDWSISKYENKVKIEVLWYERACVLVLE